MSGLVKSMALAAHLAAGFLFLFTPALTGAGSGTKLHGARFGLHAQYTRLVFDAEGERPIRVGPPSEEELTVEFGPLDADARLNKHFNQPLSAITGIRIEPQEGRGLVHIPLRQRGTTVKHAFLPSAPPRPGHYRLVLDFSSRAPAEPGKKGEPPPEVKGPAQPGQVSRDAALPSPRGEAAAQGAAEPSLPPEAASGDASMEWKPLAGRTVEKVMARVPSKPQPAAADASKSTGAGGVEGSLYELADAYFLEHQNQLSEHAAKIIQLYSNAHQAAPKAPQASQALYRIGLSTLALGNLNKAEKIFQQMLSEFPNHPLAGQGWLSLGQIYHQRESYIQSIEAFRSAMRTPGDKSNMPNINYYLGRDLSLVGAHKEAVSTLNQCMQENPAYYLSSPDILKYLGESAFTLQQYDTSRSHLFHYLNLQQDARDRDLLLAKVAEIFLNQGEQKLAAKVYRHIQTNYPGSEGDLISRIRRAEFIEKKEGGPKQEAYTIYEELSKENLPPGLRKLVFYKLASWEWREGNFEKSLHCIQQVLPSKPTGAPAYEELAALKEKVILDWAKKAFADKDCARVTQLYEDHRPVFRGQRSAETAPLIAESYGTLGLYPQAIEIYDQLFSASKKKNEEWLLKSARYTFLLGDMDRSYQLCCQIQSAPLEMEKAEIMGRIAYLQGKHADAVKLLSKLFPKDKVLAQESLVTLLPYVRSLTEVKRHEEALPLLLKAIAIVPPEDRENRAQLLVLLGRSHQELKQFPKAIETLEEAVNVIPSDDQKDPVLYELSRLYLAGGRRDQAVQKLTQLLGSSQSLWKTLAQQQLDALQMGQP